MLEWRGIIHMAYRVGKKTCPPYETFSLFLIDYSRPPTLVVAVATTATGTVVCRAKKQAACIHCNGNGVAAS
jgi:hypothetical protein